MRESLNEIGLELKQRHTNTHNICVYVCAAYVCSIGTFI